MFGFSLGLAIDNRRYRVPVLGLTLAGLCLVLVFTFRVAMDIHRYKQATIATNGKSQHRVPTSKHKVSKGNQPM